MKNFPIVFSSCALVLGSVACQPNKSQKNENRQGVVNTEERKKNFLEVFKEKFKDKKEKSEFDEVLTSLAKEKKLQSGDQEFDVLKEILSLSENVLNELEKEFPGLKVSLLACKEELKNESELDLVPFEGPDLIAPQTEVEIPHQVSNEIILVDQKDANPVAQPGTPASNPVLAPTEEGVNPSSEESQKIGLKEAEKEEEQPLSTASSSESSSGSTPTDASVKLEGEESVPSSEANLSSSSNSESVVGYPKLEEEIHTSSSVLSENILPPVPAPSEEDVNPSSEESQKIGSKEAEKEEEQPLSTASSSESSSGSTPADAAFKLENEEEVPLSLFLMEFLPTSESILPPAPASAEEEVNPSSNEGAESKVKSRKFNYPEGLTDSQKNNFRKRTKNKEKKAKLAKLILLEEEV